MALGVVALAACERGSDALPADDTRTAMAGTAAVEPAAVPASVPAARAAPVRVDSIHPPEEQLRRFREGLPVTATLTGGSESVEALAGRFLAAVASGDTAELGRMALSRAEFAHLYYPSSPFSRPPMRQDPALTWFLVQQNSAKGLTRVLRRFGPDGSPPAALERVLCERSPASEGENRLRTECALVVRWPDGRAEAVRWFGSILEREGVFKLVSYANDL